MIYYSDANSNNSMLMNSSVFQKIENGRGRNAATASKKSFHVQKIGQLEQ